MTPFKLGTRNGHAFLIDPQGSPFFSMGLNHIDHATLLRAGNLPQWRGQFRNSRLVWLAEQVGPDLRSWGFNTVGLTQELCLGGTEITTHTACFRPEEYRALAMPYCCHLPFIENHQWDETSTLPDIRGPEFAEWCDYVARTHCVELADDPLCLGYFYSDGPIWVHPSRRQKRLPMFDPARLAEPGGVAALHEMASVYYRLMHDAIRRYDPNHLILGDRYDANCPLPDVVLQAAAPFVDVISLQDFDRSVPEMCGRIAHVAQLTGRPVLLADAIIGLRPLVDAGAPAAAYAAGWSDLVRAVRSEPACVGIHACGSYLRNEVRWQRWRHLGCRDDANRMVPEIVDAFRAANRDTADWMHRLQGP
jgi:hypothetical protein